MVKLQIKDALKAEIAKDPTVKANDKYKNATDEKKQAYDDALAEAKRIDAKTDATQAEVNKANKIGRCSSSFRWSTN